MQRTRKSQPNEARTSTKNGQSPLPDGKPPDGKLAAARDAVENFLLSQFQARALRIVKIAAAPDGANGWYAEAEMLLPDLAIKMLGLRLSQEILEKEYCAVELDSSLTVKSYEILNAAER